MKSLLAPGLVLVVLVLGHACTDPSVPDGGCPEGQCEADAPDGGEAGTAEDLDASVVEDAGPPDAGPTADSGWDGGMQIRVMAANLSSGNFSSYDTGEGIRIFQALAPDVVLIQEMNYGYRTPEDIRSFVNLAFNEGFAYYREAGSLPNGIISRFPIVEWGEWDDPMVSNRDFAWARIDVPGPKDLWAVSVHLLTTRASDRSSQARELLDRVREFVPAGDYLVIGGDFNTNSVGEGSLQVLAGVVKTTAPYPADQFGDSDTNAGRTEQYDFLLADPDLQARSVPLKMKSRTYAAGLVFDSRVYKPLTDVSPVLETDSAASQMQHMAVVRDFLLTP